MPRTKRTTKTLAQRVDVNYFKRSHPYRKWRVVAGITAPLVAIIWAVGLALAGRNKPFSAGPISPPHALFGARCELCHVTRARFFQHKVSDDNCIACHDGPKHHQEQVFTPACASCHAEHRGRVQLSATSDQHCVQCHRQLRTTAGAPKFEPVVLNFVYRHPEFRATRPGFQDPGTIALNHRVHLSPGLKGPTGSVNMECGDCHRAIANKDPWPYRASRSAAPQVVMLSTIMSTNAGGSIPTGKFPSAAYMQPIKYADHCAGCHLLLYDARFTEPAPHDTPDVIHQFLKNKYSDYIALHPKELQLVSAMEQRIPQQKKIAPPRTGEEWILLQIAQAETRLWGSCKECHSVQKGNQLPVIVKSAIPSRWLVHANFDHQAHRMLDCASCHSKALRSEKTSDVLLPGIAICRQCHYSQGHANAESAESSCFECHSYHDWNKEKAFKGRYTVSQVLGHSTTNAIKR